MTVILSIPGTLPGLNEYSAAERKHRQAAAKLKRETEQRIILTARSQLPNVHLSNPVNMFYSWFEPNRRRDKDNIAFAKKFIQDALVKAGVLKNDGWEEINGFSDCFYVDKENPRIEVQLEEV